MDQLGDAGTRQAGLLADEQGLALGLDLALAQRTLSVVDLHAAAVVEGEAVEDDVEREAAG